MTNEIRGKIVKNEIKIVGKFVNSDGSTINSDHKTIDLVYAYGFTKIAPKTTTIEYESEESE